MLSSVFVQGLISLQGGISMKKYLLLSVFALFGSVQAFAYCEAEAGQFVEAKYGVRAVEARELGGGGGEGRPQDREVWVKAEDGSTYSVFFDFNNCSNVTRVIAW